MESKLDSIILTSGGHTKREQGMCAMEAVSWLNKEPHSASPKCACPVMTSAFISVNDCSDWDNDADRTEHLKPLLKKLIGTRDSNSAARAKHLALHAVTWSAPYALNKAADILERTGQKDHAKSLRKHAVKLEKIKDLRAASRAASAANAANAANAAASAAANYAASYAASAASYAASYAASAARGAARGAASYAASAAGDAASYAASAAASYAASDASDARKMRREILLERVRILSETLDLFPAGCVR